MQLGKFLRTYSKCLWVNKVLLTRKVDLESYYYEILELKRIFK